MRILAYCDEDLSVAGGGARQVIELSKALTALGHQVTLVAPEPIAGRWPADLDGITADPVPVVRRSLLRPLSFLYRSGKSLRRVLDEWCPDVFLWFDSPGQLAPLWALSGRVCPLVYFINGLPDEEVTGLWRLPPIRKALRRAIARGIRQAQALVSVCPEVLASLERLQPVDSGRCTVIRNGVDPQCFIPQSHEEARDALHLAGSGPYVGFVGGFFPWHGLEELIEAFPAVVEAYPQAQLLLVGEGQTKAAIERLVAQKRLEAHVHCPGRVQFEAVRTWIAASDVCVVLHKPTRSYPGDSMKLWEYLVCGRPVVTTTGPGYGELVEDMGAGLAAKANDAGDLARQLVRLLADGEMRRTMGERGRAAVLQSHTWRARAEQLETVFWEARSSTRRAA